MLLIAVYMDEGFCRPSLRVIYPCGASSRICQYVAARKAVKNTA